MRWGFLSVAEGGGQEYFCLDIYEQKRGGERLHIASAKAILAGERVWTAVEDRKGRPLRVREKGLQEVVEEAIRLLQHACRDREKQRMPEIK